MTQIFSKIVDSIYWSLCAPGAFCKGLTPAFSRRLFKGYFSLIRPQWGLLSLYNSGNFYISPLYLTIPRNVSIAWGLIFILESEVEKKTESDGCSLADKRLFFPFCFVLIFFIMNIPAIRSCYTSI